MTHGLFFLFNVLWSISTIIIFDIEIISTLFRGAPLCMTQKTITIINKTFLKTFLILHTSLKL